MKRERFFNNELCLEIQELKKFKPHINIKNKLLSKCLVPSVYSGVNSQIELFIDVIPRASEPMHVVKGAHGKGP